MNLIVKGQYPLPLHQKRYGAFIDAAYFASFPGTGRPWGATTKVKVKKPMQSPYRGIRYNRHGTD